jgi:dipeptidyl aminopeptidase/acylaminoacyl peptidase
MTVETASPSDRGIPARPSTRRKILRTLRLPIVLGLIVYVLWLSGCMEHLFYHPTAGPTPVPQEFAGGESVWFNSADGTRLHGWFLSASGVRPQDAPTILHAHGNAGNIESHIGFTDYLPAAGFNLFIFDYRGYGQSEGSPRKRSPLIEDTNAALNAILARPDVDRNRIGLYGQSLGGSIGLCVMANRAEIRCAVVESAFTSWRDMAATVLGGGAISQTLASLMIDDTCRADDAISQINRPVLLLHGTTDSIISIDQSRRLKEAGGDSVTLIELPGGDHNSLRDSHPHIERFVIDFFTTHLAPKQGGDS